MRSSHSRREPLAPGTVRFIKVQRHVRTQRECDGRFRWKAHVALSGEGCADGPRRSPGSRADQRSSSAAGDRTEGGATAGILPPMKSQLRFLWAALTRAGVFVLTE